MLSKKYRLNRHEIASIKKKKTPVFQGNFFGLLFENNNKENCKFGLVVSNKVISKAFLRNKVKRIFFKAVENKKDWIKGNFLFLAKKRVIEAGIGEMMIDFDLFQEKIKIKR